MDRELLRPYNHESDGDRTVLDCPHTKDEDHHRVLREGADAAVKILTKWESVCGDNMSAEQVQAGHDRHTDLCNK